MTTTRAKIEEVERLARTIRGACTEHEHVLNGNEGEEFHPSWIPEHTSPTCYVTAMSALNLRSPETGPAGDWHQDGWRCPVHIDLDRARTPAMSTDEQHEGACTHTIEVFGERELADSRQALRDLRHPAGDRTEKVWTATHVRATIEHAWQICLWLQKHQCEIEKGLLQMCDPTEVARWLETKEQWLTFHAMAEALGNAKAETATIRKGWEEWRLRQCPLAHYSEPHRRWEGWNLG